jgi:hypothetical protein
VLAAVALAMALGSGMDRPPECATVEVLMPSGRAAYLELCGDGGGAEFPVRSWAGNGPLVVDGSARLSPADCPRQAPCVLFTSIYRQS